MNNQDSLRRFILENQGVRGSLVRLSSTWADIASTDYYPDPVRTVLGEATAAAALLGRNLKFDGRLTLQLQGGEGLQLLLVQCSNQLTLRGLARYTDSLPVSFQELVAGGSLCVNGESQPGGERYQSIVPLGQTCLADCLAYYYRQSVQIPTLFLLETTRERVTGLMLQTLPDRETPAGAWEQLVAMTTDLDLNRAGQLEDEFLLTTLFPEEDVRLFQPEPVEFLCDCSEERIDRMLKMLGPEELGAMLQEQGDVDVRCEFCNRLWTVTADHLGELIDETAGQLSGGLH